MRDYSPEGYVEKLKNEAGVRKRVAWSVEDDEKMIQAHKDNKTLTETAALLSKRTEKAVKCRWDDAGTRGSPALREYAAQCSEGFASERTPRQRTPRQRTNGWTAEEEKILIEGHKNGKTLKETAFLKFEGKRSYGAVCAHWRRAKQGLTGHAELRAYMEAKFPRDEHERPGGSTSAEGGSGAKGPKPWDFAVIKIFYLGFYRRLLDAIIVDYPPFAQGHIECLMDGHAQLDYAYGVAKQLGLDLDGEKIKWTVKIVVHTASSSQAWHPDRARGLRVLSTVQSGGWKEFKMRWGTTGAVTRVHMPSLHTCCAGMFARGVAPPEVIWHSDEGTKPRVSFIVTFDIDDERIEQVMEHVIDKDMDVTTFLEEGQEAPEDDFDEYADWKLKQIIEAAGNVPPKTRDEHNCSRIGDVNRELVKKARCERLVDQWSVGC